MKTRPEVHGVLNINKPSGMTSHDVVDAVRRILGMQRVGHTGTLDPQATGVLPVCVGRATRIAQYLTQADKEYVMTLRLGITTDTLDAAGQGDGPGGGRARAARRTWRPSCPASWGRSSRCPPSTRPRSTRASACTGWPGGARSWSGNR